MKAWFVLSAICLGMVSCDQAPRHTAANTEESMSATPPPQQKPGDWMWDKEKRRNPLEAAPHTQR